MTSHYSYEEMHLRELDAPFSGITVSFPVKSTTPVLIFCTRFLQIGLREYRVSIFSFASSPFWSLGRFNNFLDIYHASFEFLDPVPCKSV
jgi:hypothetical protein